MLVPVGKAYFGFTDEELMQIDRFVRRNTVERFGPVREVVHDGDQGLVLEVAFEGLQRSTRHKSGLAMRFPRISRLRWDKPPREADRLEILEKMLARSRPAAARLPCWKRATRWEDRPMSLPTERPMANNYVTRFFGGPPLSVILRLILLSILVGVILEVLGLDPWNIIASMQLGAVRIWDLGFDAVVWLWRYFLLGAAMVVPIWLIVRLVRAPKGR